MLKITYHRQAFQELLQIQQFYKSYSDQTADYFLDEYEKMVENIPFMPEQWPLISQSLHQAVFQKFPYLLWYEIRENSILVMANKHQSRNPKFGRDQL